ncbi:MAG TPA: hypothetical protein VFQ65_17715 [Kofleriaceae bacterium]|nr:hypothetical protein [Kofleriaceae bacterium]
MRARLAATLPLIAAACGDNAAPTIGATAGARLALYGYTLDDGTELAYPYDWYDRGRDDHCVREQWSDGATYCTPFSTAVVYSDASCTAEVARISPSLIVPIKYARVLFATPTGTLLSRLRVLGDPIAVTDFYYSLDAGSCTAHAISDGATFRTITDQDLTSDAFVRIRRLTDDSGDRFAGLRDVGDDGMVVPIGFHDNQLGLDCRAIEFANADSAPCTPLNVAPAAYFTDATCHSPAVQAEYTGGTDDTIELDAGACPRYFPITQTATTALYDGTPDHCIASSPDGTYYAAGPELELGSVPRTRLTSATRFAPIALGAANQHVTDTFVHDAVLDLDCAPSQTGRCMPAIAGTLATLFTDAACLDQIQLAYVPTDCGAHATHVATDTQLFAIGAAHTAPIYTISTGDICALALPLANMELHELGASLSLDQLGAASFGVLP